jgi:hypothetical protein
LQYFTASLNVPCTLYQYILLADVYAQNVIFPPLHGDPNGWKGNVQDGERVCVYRKAETPLDLTARD